MAAVRTVRCQRCGRENREGAKFCASCGAPLTPVQEVASPPPAESGPPAPTAAAEEAKEAARKIWDLVKTVVTIGARTAWLELRDPAPALEGTVTERVKVDAVTPPSEGAFWGFVVLCFVLFVFALSSVWLFPLLAAVVTLVLSWLKWRRPYFSPLGWKSLWGLIGKPVQVPSWHLKVLTPQGEKEVFIYGEATGDEPTQGERVRFWGIFEDKAQTRLRAWKVQTLDSAGQPKGQPLMAPRLIPFVPASFFASLALFALALLMSLAR